MRECMSDKDVKENLKAIKEFDILKEGVGGLLELIEAIWWASDWGIEKNYIEEDEKEYVDFVLHTGGHSDNEDIIEVLMDTYLWFFYWQISKRGGHYWFKIPKDKMKL